MKQLVIMALVCVVSAFSTPSFANDSADQLGTVVNSGSPQRPIYALALEASGRGVAVGSLGTVLITDDGGQTWSQKYMDTRVEGSNARLAILDVTVRNGRWLVVGQQGLIRYSDNGGESWSTAGEPTKKRLMAVSSNESGLAAAVGEFGTVLVSKNGGEQWSTSELGEAAKSEEGNDSHLYDVHVSEDGAITIVGEYGIVLHSRDSGKNWERARYGGESLLGLRMLKNGEVYAVGQDGTIIYSGDDGATWRDLETGATGTLLDVHVAANGIIVVPGMRTFLVSYDDGDSWEQLAAHDFQRNWYCATVDGPHGLLIAGHSERILLLKDVSGIQSATR